MSSRCRASLFAVVLSFVLTSVCRAASDEPRERNPWEEKPRELHLFRDFERRLELAEEIVAAREGPRLFAPSFRHHLLFELSRHPVDALQEMQLTGQIAANAIGDTQKDLLYTPVAPCRAFDTRFAAAGILIGGTDRPFFLTGNGDGAFASQGGTASGCGIPYGAATAVHVNLLAVAPSSPGFMTGWAHGSTRPFISLLYYYTGTNIANAVTVPICNPSVSSQCAQGDMDLFAAVNTHVLGDVLGYFSRFPTEARRSFAWSAESQASTTIESSCTTHTGGAIAVTVPEAGKMYIAGSAVIELNHTSGSNDEIEIVVGTSTTDCTAAVARATRHLLPATAPTATNYRVTVPVSAVFSVDPAVSTTATFFINARNLGSMAGADSFISSSLIVTFHPN